MYHQYFPQYYCENISACGLMPKSKKTKRKKRSSSLLVSPKGKSARLPFWFLFDFGILAPKSPDSYDHGQKSTPPFRRLESTGNRTVQRGARARRTPFHKNLHFPAAETAFGGAGTSAETALWGVKTVSSFLWKMLFFWSKTNID